MLDNQNVRTLSSEGPIEHSVHCLIDVGPCVKSPFEVLNELETNDFGRSWRLESNRMVIEHARKVGGCDTCDQPIGAVGAISNGLRTTLIATVVGMGNDNSPPIIAVHAIGDYDEFDTMCGNDNLYVSPPGGMLTDRPLK